MSGVDKTYLLVGEVIKPHGIHGEVGVLVFTERPEIRFAVGSELWLGLDESALERVEVLQARPFKQGYLIRLSGAGDRDRAEKIRGWGLYIPAEDAAEPAEAGSYYHHQLLGMRVVDKALGELGKVVAVVETPAHDLLEIGRAGRESFYLPLIDEFIRGVDPEGGVIATGIPRELTEL